MTEDPLPVAFVGVKAMLLEYLRNQEQVECASFADAVWCAWKRSLATSMNLSDSEDDGDEQD